MKRALCLALVAMLSACATPLPQEFRTYTDLQLAEVLTEPEPICVGRLDDAQLWMACGRILGRPPADDADDRYAQRRAVEICDAQASCDRARMSWRDRQRYASEELARRAAERGQ